MLVRLQDRNGRRRSQLQHFSEGVRRADKREAFIRTAVQGIDSEGCDSTYNGRKCDFNYHPLPAVSSLVQGVTPVLKRLDIPDSERVQGGGGSS